MTDEPLSVVSPVSKPGAVESPFDGSPDRQQGVPALAVHGVVKSFGGAHALKGVDMDLRWGEVHCLVGENGTASRRS